jgi:hypothetical protein
VNDRRKTTLILGGLSLTMFSPLAMVLIGYQIPMFQNLGFERNSIASPIAWILAAIVGIVYILYTLKAIPFIASMQREISLFKLLGILAAVVGGIVEEVFFRRWVMDTLMFEGFASVIQVTQRKNQYLNMLNPNISYSNSNNLHAPIKNWGYGFQLLHVN